MITVSGWIMTGMGGASNPDLDWGIKEHELGVSLARGTLNIRSAMSASEIQNLLRGLPCRFFPTPAHHTKGRLRYWEARVRSIKLPAEGVRSWLVRLEGSDAGYFEIYASVHLRSTYHVVDLDPVELELTAP